MNWAEAIVLIVIISAVANVFRSRHPSGSRSRKLSRSDDHTQTAQISSRERELQGEVMDLRERIKVLERIATDANSTEGRNSRAISDEIERLRDQ